MYLLLMDSGHLTSALGHSILCLSTSCADRDGSLKCLPVGLQNVNDTNIHQQPLAF